MLLIMNPNRHILAKKTKNIFETNENNSLTYPDSYFESLAESVWLDGSCNGSVTTGAPGCPQQQRKPRLLGPNQAPFAIFISCFGAVKRGNQQHFPVRNGSVRRISSALIPPSRLGRVADRFACVAALWNMAQHGHHVASSQKALMLEMKSLQDEPVEGFKITLVDESDMYNWEVAIFGAPNTHYEGGYFKVSG